MFQSLFFMSTSIVTGLFFLSIFGFASPQYITVNPLSTGKILLTNKPARSTVIESLLPPKELGFGPQSLQRLYTPQRSGGNVLIDDLQDPAPLPGTPPAQREWTPPRSRIGSPFVGSGNSQFDLALNVPEEFQCSLFDNPEYSSMLYAIQSLNQAIQSPLCKKDSIDKNAILANTKKIQDTIALLRNQIGSAKNSPEALTPEGSIEMGQRLDGAILAAIDLANTFSQQSLFQESCQPGSGGQIALAINEIINGLTPYALMAVTSTGVGTAALPYILGGSAITGAISSLNQTFTQKNLDLSDPNIRKAILENTCQYIKLTQRNQFILYERSFQVAKISEEINQSVAFFNTATSQLPANLLKKFKSYEKRDSEIEFIEKENDSSLNALTALKNNLQNQVTPDSICFIGRQFLGGKEGHYLSLPFTMIELLQRTLQLKSTSMRSPAYAVIDAHERSERNLKDLIKVERRISPQDIQTCARVTQTWINAIENGLLIITKTIKEEKSSFEKETAQDPDYATYRNMEKKIIEKKQMADKVILAMDNLKEYSSVFMRSDMSEELSRLRKGLLTGTQGSIKGVNMPLLPGSKAPVLQWFGYKFERHQSKINDFLRGLSTLRIMSSHVLNDNKVIYKKAEERQKSVRNLWPLISKYLKPDAQEYKTVCRELRAAWFHYVSAVDHLASAELFCAMLEPIIYDQTSVDQNIISICQGQRQSLSNKRHPSQILIYKNNLVKNKTKDWALHVWKYINELQCPASTLN